MPGPILGQSIVVATPDQISSNLAGEIVVLNAKEGAYYSLHDVGARVWDMVQQPRRVAEIQEAIAREYDVDPEKSDRDVAGFLEELAGAGLIEICDEPNW